MVNPRNADGPDDPTPGVFSDPRGPGPRTLVRTGGSGKRGRRGEKRGPGRMGSDRTSPDGEGYSGVVCLDRNTEEVSGHPGLSDRPEL